MTCPYHKNNNICQIATDVADAEVLTNKNICSACESSDKPRALNRITVSNGLSYLQNIKHPNFHIKLKQYEKQYLRIKKESETEDMWLKLSDGVGTELHKLLGKINIRPIPNCKCIGLAREMNEKGVEWCSNNIIELSRRLIPNFFSWVDYLIRKTINKILLFFQKRNLVKIILTRIFKILLKMAIKNAKTSS